MELTDLLDTLSILKVRRRIIAGGAWVGGTICGHRFEALVFPEHAENPGWEIEGSRISKLWIERTGDRATVANFDRGWDVRPTSETATAIVDLLAAGLADVIYEV